MELYLCEKPLQGKAVARVLGTSKQGKGYLHDGRGCHVAWLKGHLLVQAQPEDYDPGLKRWSHETLPIMPEKWKLVIPSKALDQYRLVSELIRKADIIHIATDYDREGEAIARNLIDRVRYKGPIRRICLNGMDERSIRRALDNPIEGHLSLPLFEAAVARSRADWLVGMNLSRLYTLLARRAGINDLFSVGRVQTCLVRLVADRDRAIANFTPSEFQVIRATFRFDDQTVEAAWVPPEVVSDSKGRCIHVTIAKRFQEILKGKEARVAQLESADRQKNPPLPFSMATLQQHCVKRYGLSAKETARIAQSLYEKHQAISYTRTNTGYLLPDQFPETPDIFDALRKSDPSVEEALAGANPHYMGRAFDASKVGSHPGITPTCTEVDLGNMSELELKIYRDIRLRFIAQFYPSHEYTRREIIIVCSDQQFRSCSNQQLKQGWKTLYGAVEAGEEPHDEESEWEEDRRERERQPDPHEGDDEAEDEVDSIPLLAVGVTGKCNDASLGTRMTRPPGRFSEASLIAAMNRIGRYVEEEDYRQILDRTTGIGTPSTWASIIEECISREYLQREKKSIRSTDKAIALLALVHPEITSAGVTALWEQKLEQIANGALEREHFLQEIREWIEKLVAEVLADPVAMTMKAEAALAELARSHTVPCPVCGGSMSRTRCGGEFRWRCSELECACSLADCNGRPDEYRGSEQRNRGI